MRGRKWLIVFLGGAGLIAGFWFAGGGEWLRSLVATPGDEPRPGSVPEGDQEIAWIRPATSTDAWEQFVAGARLVCGEVDGLHVRDDYAFPERTTAVPELTLEMDGCPHRLHIRWYKLTSRADIPEWVAALAQREPPPLAIIGGENTNRAKSLAEALNTQGGWGGPKPLLLLTTATAVYLDPVNKSDRLMERYPGRMVRFCFDNEQIAHAVLDFLKQDAELRPSSMVFALNWQDDPYSQDLFYQYQSHLLKDPLFGMSNPHTTSIPYSVGQYYQANPREAEALQELLGTIPQDADHRSLLILPIGTAPARRILHGLCAASPEIGQQLVAVTGDSISWNTVFRDREVAWDIQAMPVPLVLFSHQNPVAWEKREQLPAKPHGTDSVLLNADIVSVVARTAFQPVGNQPSTAIRLATNADELLKRLKPSPSQFFVNEGDRFFDKNGNRLRGTGECVVTVRPQYAHDEQRLLPWPELEVYQYQSAENGLKSWKRIFQWDGSVEGERG